MPLFIAGDGSTLVDDIWNALMDIVTPSTAAMLTRGDPVSATDQCALKGSSVLMQFSSLTPVDLPDVHDPPADEFDARIWRLARGGVDENGNKLVANDGTPLNFVIIGVNSDFQYTDGGEKKNIKDDVNGGVSIGVMDTDRNNNSLYCVLAIVDASDCGGQQYRIPDPDGNSLSNPVPSIVYHELSHLFAYAKNNGVRPAVATQSQAIADENDVRTIRLQELDTFGNMVHLCPRGPDGTVAKYVSSADDICGPPDNNCHKGNVPDGGICLEDSDCASKKCNDVQLCMSGCLIASAATGSPFSDEVQRLRELRDRILRSTHLGFAFFEGFWEEYYSFSPEVARVIERDHELRVFVRDYFVRPLVALAELAAAFSFGGGAGESWHRRARALLKAAPQDARAVARARALLDGGGGDHVLLALVDPLNRSSLMRWSLFEPIHRFLALVASDATPLSVQRSVEEWLDSMPVLEPWTRLGANTVPVDALAPLFSSRERFDAFRALVLTGRERSEAPSGVVGVGPANSLSFSGRAIRRAGTLLVEIEVSNAGVRPVYLVIEPTTVVRAGDALVVRFAGEPLRRVGKEPSTPVIRPLCRGERWATTVDVKGLGVVRDADNQVADVEQVERVVVEIGVSHKPFYRDFRRDVLDLDLADWQLAIRRLEFIAQ